MGFGTKKENATGKREREDITIQRKRETRTTTTLTERKKMKEKFATGTTLRNTFTLLGTSLS